MASAALLDVDSIGALSRLDKGALRFRHLETAFDFDPPRRRLALCYWRPGSAAWVTERGSSHHGWTELHVVGEMLFGPSPWRRACVLPVFGRLGSVELAVSSLPAPGPAFSYSFEFEVDADKRVASVRAKYVRGLWEAAEAAYYDGVPHA